MPLTMLPRLLVLFVSIQGTAYAQNDNVVTGFRPLFRAALDAVNGQAVANLEGGMAQHLRAKHPGLKSILAEARILRRFEQEGCARFALTITPVGLPDIPPNMTMSINWCRDGSMPDDSPGGSGKGEGG